MMIIWGGEQEGGKEGEQEVEGEEDGVLQMQSENENDI